MVAPAPTPATAPASTTTSTPASVPPEPRALVACLCAAWCGTCASYEHTFAQLAAGMTWPLDGLAAEEVRWLWIDVEDQADALGDLDIENFPTLAVVRGASLQFFGTVLPHEATARRLVASCLAGPAVAVPPGVPADMVERLWRLAS